MGDINIKMLPFIATAMLTNCNIFGLFAVQQNLTDATL
jgi:hypothetical protein